MRDYTVFWRRPSLNVGAASYLWELFEENPGSFDDGQGNTIAAEQVWFRWPHKSSLLSIFRQWDSFPIGGGTTDYIQVVDFFDGNIFTSKDKLNTADSAGYYYRKQTGHLVWVLPHDKFPTEYWML